MVESLIHSAKRRLFCLIYLTYFLFHAKISCLVLTQSFVYYERKLFCLLNLHNHYGSSLRWYFEEQNLCSGLEALNRLDMKFHLIRLKFQRLHEINRFSFSSTKKLNKWHNLWIRHSCRCTLLHFFIQFINKHFLYSAPIIINSH
jgi:hypothetical protein